jgi:predicted GNAT family acetyltransferase
LKVRHEPEESRFVVANDQGLAVLEYARVDAATLDYHHTFVPPSLRGQGIASRLAEHALQHALDESLAVVPSCPFVAAYIRRNPKFDSLVRE